MWKIQNPPSRILQERMTTKNEEKIWTLLEGHGERIRKLELRYGIHAEMLVCQDCGKNLILAWICPRNEVIQALEKQGVVVFEKEEEKTRNEITGFGRRPNLKPFKREE